MQHVATTLRLAVAVAGAGAVCLALAAPADAHGVVGQRAADVQFKSWAQEKGAPKGPKSLDALRGRPVMLGFFGCHDPLGVGDVTRLNAAFDTQGPKGLMVIGVAPEDDKEVQLFRIRNQCHYPCVSDSGGKIAKAFGIEGARSCVLISATGRVLWAGLPRDLATEPVEAACTPAIKRFLGERDASLRAVWDRIDAQDYGTAWKALSKMDTAPGKALLAELLGFTTEWTALARLAQDDADHTTAVAMLKDLAGWMKGHESAAAAKALTDAWKSDAAVKTELKTEGIIDQAKSMELRYDYRTAMALYQKAVKTGGAGAAAKRAAALLDHIEQFDLLAINKSCPDCRTLRAPCEAHTR